MWKKAQSEEEWNRFDTLDDKTRLLHNTMRITQPWRTGLPVDFVQKPLPRFLRVIPREWLNPVRSILTGRPHPPYRTYQPHPDPRQVSLFFGLLKEAVEHGLVSRELIERQIASNNVRHDAFALLDAQ